MPETILGQFLMPFRMLYRQRIAAPKTQQRASLPSAREA
jgi:hypothetical protein